MFGILAFGDSIVFGRGDNADRGWVGRLREYFESKDYYNGVYNLGIPGNTSSDLLDRFETECKARIKNTRPGDRFVIMIGIGANDSRVGHTDPAVFEKNIIKLIKLAKKYSDEVVFVGLNSVDESKTMPYENTTFTNERLKQFNDIAKQACKDILFIDLDEFVPDELDDGLHPNAKGYEKMFKTIKKFLVSNKVID